MNVRILSILLLISLCVLFSFLFFIRHFLQSESIFCSGLVDVKINNDVNKISGSVFFSAHIMPEKGKRGYVSERGYFTVDSHKFTVARHVRLFFNDVNDNGFSEVTIEGIDKSSEDTLPDELYNKLYNSQKVFYYKFEKIQGDLWRWRDLQRTLLICKVTT